MPFRFRVSPELLRLIKLYGDRKLSPWLRCFVAVWLSLLVTFGASYASELLANCAMSHVYIYGSYAFWCFYTPVFGLFVSFFYYEHTGDGAFTTATSYVVRSRGLLEDFLDVRS